MPVYPYDFPPIEGKWCTDDPPPRKKKFPKYDMRWSFAVVEYLYTLVGLHKVNVEDGRFASISLGLRIYSAVFGLLIGLFEVYIIIFRIELYSVYGTRWTAMDIFMSTPTYLSVISAVIISATFAPRPMVKFMTNLDTIDRDLAVDVKGFYTQLRNIIVGVKVLTVTVTTAAILSEVYTFGFGYMSLFWFFHNIVVDMNTMEMLTCVCVLKARLERLNQRLGRICDEAVKGLKVDESFGCRRRGVHDLNFLKKSYDVYDIVQLMMVYDKIADNIHILHYTYGVSLFLTSVSAFSNLLTLFNNYLIFYKHKDENYLLILNSVVWGVKYFWWPAIGAFACSALQNTTQKTINLLDKLVLYPDSDIRERQIAERFTNTIRCRPLTITACNFFNYDSEFIGNLIGAFLSYSIILLQNDMNKA